MIHKYNIILTGIAIMNKQGYLIGVNRKATTYFTASSAYDRPQWVPLTEATVYPTAELATAAIKKLCRYGSYSASLIHITEAVDALPKKKVGYDDPSFEGLPPEDVELLSQPDDENLDDENLDDESGYGADGETDTDGISAMDGEGLDDEGLDGENGFTFEMPDDENEDDENAISNIELKMMKRRPTTNEALDHNGDRVFQTYAAWKRAVKAINPNAEFYGDKDIGGAKGIGEWDGDKGLIFASSLRKKWADEKLTESILTELSKTTLTSYIKKAVKSTKDLVDKGDMIKSVDRAKKTAWASGKLKERKYTESIDNSKSGEYPNKPCCDKINVPSSIKSTLSSLVNEFKKKANDADGKDGKQGSQSLTIASALQQLLDDLSLGTVDGMKQAQIHMTSYMTPITQHIPAEVTKFIAKGGKQESLSDMFNTIKESKRMGMDEMSHQFVSKR